MSANAGLRLDAEFADAIVTRRLWELPPLLSHSELRLSVVLQALQCCAKATQPRDTMLVRTLRKTLSLAVIDNDLVIPKVAPLLHELATKSPADSLGGDVAGGLLLLFAHGLGQIASPSSPSSPSSSQLSPSSESKSSAAPALLVDDKPLVVMLGFAGGTPNDVRQYSSRIYPDDKYETLVVTASEIPEIYNQSIQLVLQTIQSSQNRSWTIHLFSKAGFLLCARLMNKIIQNKSRADALQASACVISSSLSRNVTVAPSAIIWDSSPGSVKNYDEFIQGTWQSAELIAKRGQFVYSKEARVRMNRILTSEAYPYSVRDSYAPMHSLMPFPDGSGRTQHLFLFSESDTVCSPDDIKRYAQECVKEQTSVVVSGTHCDGLFWSKKKYMEAVSRLMASV